MTIVRKQDLKCFWEQQFCTSFYVFEIRKEQREDYMKVQERKVRLGLWDS